MLPTPTTVRRKPAQLKWANCTMLISAGSSLTPTSCAALLMYPSSPFSCVGLDFPFGWAPFEQGDGAEEVASSELHVHVLRPVLTFGYATVLSHVRIR